MRRHIKHKTLNWINTMKRAYGAITQLILKRNYDLLYKLLTEMQKGAMYIGNQIDATGENEDIVRDLEYFCELVWSLSEHMEHDTANEYCHSINEQVSLLENKIKNISSDKLEVVFLPYKSSMWDSFESIWKTAMQDIDCNCSVIPIPYYSKNSQGQLETFCYEGGDYPEEVPVTDYNQYDLEKKRPDIIFIHNPYDDGNLITSIEPMYYSSRIKDFTGLLIYVPYPITGFFENYNAGINWWCHIPGIVYSHKIIVQSEEFKQVFLKGGVKESKLLLLGSPKLDASIEHGTKKTQSEEAPADSKQQFTFLLNTTIAYLLKENNKWFSYMDNILKIFEADSTLKLIWRPHPLLEDTIRAMRTDLLENYLKLVNKIENMENVIIDKNPDTYASFAESDALISDYSSLMMQYVVTGKPILNTEGSAKDKETKVVVFDFYSNYFLNDGVTYEDFIDIVKNKKDDKKELRLQAMYNSIPNSDGTCGMKVYEECKKLIQELN